MDTEELQRRLDDIFDQALLFHTYAYWMRDYEMVVHCTADPRTGIPPANLRYLFKYCTEARVESTVRPDVWRRSLDNRLIDYRTGVDLDGFVWGVQWSCLYPGGSIVEDSSAAARWAEAIGLDFHEVQIETEAYKINLVFSDLSVSEVGPGYSPLTVYDGGPDFKIPLPPPEDLE